MKQPSEDLLPKPRKKTSMFTLHDKTIILERPEEDSLTESAPSRLSNTESIKSEPEEEAKESLSDVQVYDLFYLKRQLDAFRFFEEMRVQRYH